eukprot:jgi/Mesen1/1063/ME000123S00243
MAFAFRALLKLQQRPLTTAGLLLTCGYGTAVAFTEADSAGQSDGRIGGFLAGGRGIIRSTRAISTFAANSFDYKYSLLKVELQGVAKRKTPEYRQIRSEIHLRSAQRLLKLCESNRGIYIKAGQFVASLQHLPQEYTNTLSVLQDQRGRGCGLLPLFVAPAGPPGRDFWRWRVLTSSSAGADSFAEFERRPIAAASLAQVHRAVLKDGREVAVKIQYPGLEKQVEEDLATMTVLSKAVGWVHFCKEGHNAERSALNFVHKKELKIPAVHWELTTRRVLTMQFMRGCKVDDVEGIRQQGLDPKQGKRLSCTRWPRSPARSPAVPRAELTRTLGCSAVLSCPVLRCLRQVAAVLVEVFAEMVFCHGYLHGDPHPGNILVKANSLPGRARNFDLVLLDHGLYRELDEEFRAEFCRLWQALILADVRAVQAVGDRLGAGAYAKFLPVVFTGRPATSLSCGVSFGVVTRRWEFSIGDLSAIIEGLPKDMFLVMRTEVSLCLGASRQRVGAGGTAYRWL